MRKNKTKAVTAAAAALQGSSGEQRPPAKNMTAATAAAALQGSSGKQSPLADGQANVAQGSSGKRCPLADGQATVVRAWDVTHHGAAADAVLPQCGHARAEAFSSVLTGAAASPPSAAADSDRRPIFSGPKMGVGPPGATAVPKVVKASHKLRALARACCPGIDESRLQNAPAEAVSAKVVQTLRLDTTGDFGSRLQALVEIDRGAFDCPQVDNCVCRLMLLADQRPFGRRTASDQALRQVIDDMCSDGDACEDEIVPR
jgi:hypothetical protein